MVAYTDGLIDNVIARSLHGKRRSNPVKTVNLPDVGLTRCNDAAGEGIFGLNKCPHDLVT
ncbi:MAG: hypothetical protein LBK53_07325 [Heliobacteriaceae bacterium]|nr:hypothetical protein [Heliobacteriaceae bacterium]